MSDDVSKARIRDLTAYAWQVLEQVEREIKQYRELRERFEKQGYAEIQFSGVVAVLLPHIRIPFPLLQGVDDGKESS